MAEDDSPVLDQPKTSSAIPGWGENVLGGVDFSSKPAPAATPATPSLIDRYGPARLEGLQSDLAGIERQRGEAMERSQGMFEGMLARDRQRMDQSWEATRAAADRVPPEWNADREREARIKGPIENFGSIGSIFGILASAFTRTPLTSALNASASAMEAIRDNDEAGYRKAYDAWKENTNLALKRFNMERQVFEDANKLVTTDISLWRARTLADAARFDNKKTIALLNAGLDPEVLKAQDAQIKAASDLVKVQQEWETYDIRRSLYAQLVKSWDEANPDAQPQQKALARLQITESLSQQGGNSWQINVLRNARMTALSQGRILTPEEEGALIQRLQSYGRATNNPQWQYVQRRVEELTKPASEGGEGLSTTEAMRRAEQEWKESSVAPAKAGSQADFIARRSKELQEQDGISKTEADKQAASEWRKAQQPPAREGTVQEYVQRRSPEIMEEQGISKTEADKKAVAEWETAKAQGRNAVVSGNRRDQIASMITRIDAANQTIDKVEALLKKHKAITGLGGTITRPGEIVSNWFGSNETDRAQFRRYVEELREWGARILNESTSRPLAAEESRIAAILPGLNAGDTTANTVRGLLEVRKLFGQFRGDLDRRFKGTWSPDTGLPPVDAKPKPSGDKPAWDEAPIKVPAKRSSLDEGRVVSDETEDDVQLGARYARVRLPPDATAQAVEQTRQRADRMGRTDRDADPLDALPFETMPPRQRIERGFDAVGQGRQSMRLDPMPNIPSPPSVPKEWPPHPLNPTRLAGDVAPLPIRPGPNAGPASLEQSINPTGENVIQIPREKLREFLKRRSWAELQRYLDEQTG